MSLRSSGLRRCVRGEFKASMGVMMASVLRPRFDGSGRLRRGSAELLPRFLQAALIARRVHDAGGGAARQHWLAGGRHQECGRDEGE